jgi:hypothetical protein
MIHPCYFQSLEYGTHSVGPLSRSHHSHHLFICTILRRASIVLTYSHSYCVLARRSAHNIRKDPDLLQILKQAKVIGDNYSTYLYKPPDPKKISGDLLNLQYEQLYLHNVKLMKTEESG